MALLGTYPEFASRPRPAFRTAYAGISTCEARSTIFGVIILGFGIYPGDRVRYD